MVSANGTERNEPSPKDVSGARAESLTYMAELLGIYCDLAIDKNFGLEDWPEETVFLVTPDTSPRDAL